MSTSVHTEIASVLSEIETERRRQIDQEGWSTEHDDRHTPGELATAGACYANHYARFHDAETLGATYAIKAFPQDWPWAADWWKPKSPRRDLIRAAALIIAEIERLDRTHRTDDQVSTP